MALIELSEVGKIYRSLRGTDYQALRDFDLRIERGEFFCLKAVIDVNLEAGQRDRTNDGYVAVYRPVHALLRDEVAIAMRRAA